MKKGNRRKMRVSLIRSRIERMQKAKVLPGPVISFIIAEKRERPVHSSVGVSGARVNLFSAWPTDCKFPGAEGTTEETASAVYAPADYIEYKLSSYRRKKRIFCEKQVSAAINAADTCLYKDLIENAKADVCPAAEYTDKKCAVIIYSSGTTGTPKPIELGDSALNSAVHKLIDFGLNLTGSNIMLKIIPSHIGMGSITTLYTCLISGDILVYFPAIGPRESIENVLKKIIEFPEFLRQNSLPVDTKLLLFAAPMYFRALLQLSENIRDMSYIGCMLAAGSAMSKEELEKMDAVFGEKGCMVPVLNGYGQNEMAGGVTMTGIYANKRGSAGRPMADTEIRIVDMMTGTHLPINNIGKILERSESLFIGYENMPERTKSSFITDENGNTWFDTNDIGYIDEEGFLFITGRTSRIIICFDMKVSLDKIEEKIRMSKFVDETGVTAVKHIPYDIPVAFVTLNDEFIGANITPEMILNDIQSGGNPLNELEMVGKLSIIDALPYLSSGKVDYRTLEKMAEEAPQPKTTL